MNFCQKRITINFENKIRQAVSTAIIGSILAFVDLYAIKP